MLVSGWLPPIRPMHAVRRAARASPRSPAAAAASSFQRSRSWKSRVPWRADSTTHSWASARERGAHAFLRGADALYVAAAEAFAAPLLSWDRELITRAGAITPQDWLAETNARS